MRMNGKSLKWLAFAFGAMLGFGTVLDAIGNSISLIEPWITYYGTICILVALAPIHYLLRKIPLSIEGGNGEIEVVRGLNAKIIAGVIGIVLMLWIPRYYNPKPPVTRRDTVKETSHNLTQVSNQLPQWPEKTGVYTVKPRESIPVFPTLLNEYRPTGKNTDFWGNPFKTNHSIRIFTGDDWAMIPDFPLTMNNCGAGMFMLRWRASNSETRVASIMSYSIEHVKTSGEIGAYGYMYGTNCKQPMFKLLEPITGEGGSLTNIYYELSFWEAAP